MLNSTSKVHELFRELSSLGANYETYEILRSTFNVISGKTNILHFFNDSNRIFTYLEKVYTDKQIEKFYNMLKKIDFEDYKMPIHSKYEPKEVIDLKDDVDEDINESIVEESDKNKLYKAWLLGYLTAKLFN